MAATSDEGTTRPRLDYDVIIVTRNRPEALSLSVPLLIGQSRQPQKLIVIDSSDDHGPAAETIAQATDNWSGDLIVEHTAPGSTLQRNFGLTHVTAPVVVFPDDDSLYCAGALEAMLEIYERDHDGAIAGVCAAEAQVPPDGVLEGAAYQMLSEHRSGTASRRVRRWLERRITALKPALAIGRALNGRHSVPDWLAAMDARPVEYMTGFRMSFRTEAIRPVGFDEALDGYALEEDVDASFTAMQSGLVVGALRARVYHHRFPSGRGDAFTRGRMEILNRTYVLSKHTTGPTGTSLLARAALRAHVGFVLFKFASLVPSLGSAYGRARFVGAWSGAKASRTVWRADPDDRAATYLAAVGLRQPV